MQERLQGFWWSRRPTDGLRREGVRRRLPAAQPPARSSGARTWGGEIWLSGVNTLSDGGIARAPMNGVYADGKWLIEQEGVIPDINGGQPAATFLGGDAQLDAAIGYLPRKKIAEDPQLM
ncbi:MAG: hypothetical protein R2882_01230 [Gemmatimonadales bacterium]